MTIEEKVKQPHIKKFIIWITIISAISLTAFCYHRFFKPHFSPAATVSCVILIAAAAFYFMGLWDYFTDKSFSGTIKSYKATCRIFKVSAFERRLETRIFVEMTVEGDDGKTFYHEEMLSSALSKSVPYREGDRVYHMKGAKYTCRFPRNDTAKKYDPISVICPICGALHPLGTKLCSFCENDLPWDPSVK